MVSKAGASPFQSGFLTRTVFSFGFHSFLQIRTGLGQRIGVDALALGGLDRLLRNDIAGDVGKSDRPERGKRLVQYDHAFTLAGDLHMGQRPHIGLVRGFQVRIDDALERELHVLGGHRTESVGEADIVAQART